MNDQDLKCMCGHIKIEHGYFPTHPQSGQKPKLYCQGCATAYPKNPRSFVHCFTQDNLSYIENLAKERNLI